jgi:hypothetical protein
VFYLKLLGVLSMAAVPAGLLTVPFIENVNKFQNPFRRPVAMTVFLAGTVIAIWLGFEQQCQLIKQLPWFILIENSILSHII